MQNMFTSEHLARIKTDTYRDEARRHEILKLARIGQPRHVNGLTLLATIRTGLASLRSERHTMSQPACQSGMAC